MTCILAVLVLACGGSTAPPAQDDDHPTAPTSPEAPETTRIDLMELTDRFFGGSAKVTYRVSDSDVDSAQPSRLVHYKDGFVGQRFDFIGPIAERSGGEFSLFATGPTTQTLLCGPGVLESGLEPVDGTPDCFRDDGTVAGPMLASFGFSLEYRSPARVPAEVTIDRLPSRDIAGVRGQCFRVAASDVPGSYGETCYGPKGELLYALSSTEGRSWSIEAVEIDQFRDEDLRLP